MINFDISQELFRAIVGIFVIVDPVGSVGIFLYVTSGFSKQKKEKAARFAGITVASTLIAAALAGQAALDLFGIRLAAFSVAGGILFLILAVEMIKGDGSSQLVKQSDQSDHKPAAAIVPLGVPLMAGPGAISTVILTSPGSSNWFDTSVLIASILVLGFLTWLCFSFSNHIGRLLGDIGLQLFSRIMGLILAALAVEYTVKGLQVLFKLPV